MCVDVDVVCGDGGDVVFDVRFDVGDADGRRRRRARVGGRICCVVFGIVV